MTGSQEGAVRELLERAPLELGQTDESFGTAWSAVRAHDVSNVPELSRLISLYPYHACVHTTREGAERINGPVDVIEWRIPDALAEARRCGYGLVLVDESLNVVRHWGPV